jgi:hypothetical protein
MVQRTILFCQDWEFDGVYMGMAKEGRTHAVIEDPWLGTRSTSNVCIALKITVAARPTKWTMMMRLQTTTPAAETTRTY